MNTDNNERKIERRRSLALFLIISLIVGASAFAAFLILKPSTDQPTEDPTQEVTEDSSNEETTEPEETPEPTIDPADIPEYRIELSDGDADKPEVFDFYEDDVLKQKIDGDFSDGMTNVYEEGIIDQVAINNSIVKVAHEYSDGELSVLCVSSKDLSDKKSETTTKCS